MPRPKRAITSQANLHQNDSYTQHESIAIIITIMAAQSTTHKTSKDTSKDNYDIDNYGFIDYCVIA